MMTGFNFIISMITQLFGFLFSINLGGVTIGGIFAMLFLFSMLMSVLFALVGGVSLRAFKPEPEKNYYSISAQTGEVKKLR